MAGIECAKKAFQDIISDFKNFRTAKLMVFIERGMLKVIRKDNFALTDRRREVHTARRAGDSRRAAPSAQGHEAPGGRRCDLRRIAPSRREEEGGRLHCCCTSS